MRKRQSDSGPLVAVGVSVLVGAVVAGALLLPGGERAEPREPPGAGPQEVAADQEEAQFRARASEFAGLALDCEDQLRRDTGCSKRVSEHVRTLTAEALTPAIKAGQAMTKQRVMLVMREIYEREKRHGAIR